MKGKNTGEGAGMETESIITLAEHLKLGKKKRV